ncbi:hypothetical protein FHG87_016288 [Trinorchestia longiramus]|nr:hypothetical protein FHG87_016288 [Trinorchestia longiramus]
MDHALDRPYIICPSVRLSIVRPSVCEATRSGGRIGERMSETKLSSGRRIKICCSLSMIYTSVSQSGPYRPPGGVEEMQGGGRRVRLEWRAYIIV